MIMRYPLATAALRLLAPGLLWPLLGRGQSSNLPHPAELLNQAFPRRLEASFPYQEAALPAGLTSRKSYLKVGAHQYLLAEAALLPQDGRLRQDEYALHTLGGALQASFQRRYLQEVSPAMSSPGLRVSYYQAYVFTDQDVRQTKALLLQNFVPQQLFETLPAAGEPRFFYVLDNRPASKGDTLASYQVARAAGSQSCQLTLWQPLNPLRRRWQANCARTQTWDFTWQGPLLQRVVAERAGQRWTRQYRTAHDFTETLETAELAAGRGGGSTVHTVVYQRHYRRRGPHRALDTYRVPGFTAGAAPVKFSVVQADS